MLRDEYLEKNNQRLWSDMQIDGVFKQYLLEIDRAAEAMEETMEPKLMQQLGVTEELKEKDQMEWVARMNQVRNIIHETIMHEIVYA